MVMKAGIQTRTLHIDAFTIAASLGNAACEAHIGIHDFTGCDSTSDLAYHRMPHAGIKLIRESAEFRAIFQEARNGQFLKVFRQTK